MYNQAFAAGVLAGFEDTLEVLMTGVDEEARRELAELSRCIENARKRKMPVRRERSRLSGTSSSMTLDRHLLASGGARTRKLTGDTIRAAVGIVLRLAAREQKNEEK